MEINKNDNLNEYLPYGDIEAEPQYINIDRIESSMLNSIDGEKISSSR